MSSISTFTRTIEKLDKLLVPKKRKYILVLPANPDHQIHIPEHGLCISAANTNENLFPVPNKVSGFRVIPTFCVVQKGDQKSTTDPILLDIASMKNTIRNDYRVYVKSDPRFEEEEEAYVFVIVDPYNFRMIIECQLLPISKAIYYKNVVEGKGLESDCAEFEWFYEPCKSHDIPLAIYYLLEPKDFSVTSKDESKLNKLMGEAFKDFQKFFFMPDTTELRMLSTSVATHHMDTYNAFHWLSEK